MQPSNINPVSSFNRRQIAFLIVSFLVFAISVLVYSGRSNSFAAAQPKNLDKISITNPFSLMYWMPQATYNYAIGRINDYLAQEQIKNTSATVIDNNVQVDNSGTISFDLSIRSSPKVFHVAVANKNLGGVVNSTVFIDGKAQLAVPLSRAGGTSFSGFDNLTALGVTSDQNNLLQKVVLNFNPDAKTVVVATNNIGSAPPNSSGAALITFTVVINNVNYSAKLYYSGLTSIQLLLYDSGGKQIFDSGLQNS